MNFSRLFYQTVILFALYRFGVCDVDGKLKFSLETIKMIIDGISKNWTSISIKRYMGRDAYAFSSKELNALIGGEFSSRNVEIVILVEQTMRFTISRLGTNRRFHFNVLFPTDNHTQRFFRDIRYEQRRDCGERIKIDRIFKYPKGDSANGDKILFPLSCANVFYAKRMDSARFDHSKSFNFVRVMSSKSQEADLIVQPKTFNISQRFCGNKYVLCAHYDQFSLYVLRFPSGTEADKFFASVENDIDPNIVCSTDWLTPELSQQIDSPQALTYPHLPYVRPCSSRISSLEPTEED